MRATPSLLQTFLAALRSVGAAGTLALGGAYLHRRGVLDDKNKKQFALFSQQLAIPALFFTNIVNCPQDWTDVQCPNVIDQMNGMAAWILIWWPLFVVGVGLLVGHVACCVADTPRSGNQRRCVLAACAFGNSSGLPITLLAVIQSNVPPSQRDNIIDPSLLLSIYLLIYPILQWGIGGWLLSVSCEEQDQANRENHIELKRKTTCDLEVEDENLDQQGIRPLITNDNDDDKDNKEDDEGDNDNVDQDDNQREYEEEYHHPQPLAHRHRNDISQEGIEHNHPSPSSNVSKDDGLTAMQDTISNILSKALQPPVVAALLGLFVTSVSPLRGIFVDMKHRDDDALLEWLFDGLSKIGNAAIPVNMCILGCNLSIAWEKSFSNYKSNPSSSYVVSTRTIGAVVIGKLIIMPCVGIFAAFCLQYILILPDDVRSSFYLVLMLVTVTPTANNVMVMVELYGSGMKEGMAKMIGWQYVVSPVVLSVTMMVVMQMAGR